MGIQLRTARKDDTYRLIYDSAIDYLQSKRPYFAKRWVTRHCKAVAHAINWKHVVKMIEEDHDCKLVPVAESFFKRPTERELELYSDHALDTLDKRIQDEPGKYLAVGHGKKAFGYASIKCAGGALHVQQLKYKRKIRDGMTVAVQSLAYHIKTKLPSQEHVHDQSA